MHPRWKLLTALAATAVLAHAPAAAHADADPCTADAAPAKCYLTAAQNLRETKPGEAAALYLKSYRLEPKIDPLAGYGFALALDNQDVAAAEVLEKAVEQYNKLRAQLEQSNADANTLFQVIHRVEFVREELNKLVPKIGKVQLKVTDGRLPRGVTSVARKNGSDLHGSNVTTLLVIPNSDVLVFTFASGKTLDYEVNVPAGTISTVEIPAEPQPPPPPPPPPAPPYDEGIPLRRFGYISGGAGAVVLIGGFTYMITQDVASAGFAAGVTVVGVAGITAGIYLWRLGNKQSAARKTGGTTTAVVPVLTDHMIGAAFTGTL